VYASCSKQATYEDDISLIYNFMAPTLFVARRFLVSFTTTLKTTDAACAAAIYEAEGAPLRSGLVKEKGGAMAWVGFRVRKHGGWKRVREGG